MQEGFQLTFYTQQDRLRGTEPLAHWLLMQARQLGLRGATVSAAVEGFGHDGQLHQANMFDLSSQPVQITMIVSEAEMTRLFRVLEQEEVALFYTRQAIEFGTAGVHP